MRSDVIDTIRDGAVKPCIDAHSHYLPSAVLNLLRESGSKFGTPVETNGDGKTFVVTPERPYGPIGANFHDIALRRQYLDKWGIATQILVPPPFLFYYWSTAKDTHTVIRMVNDSIAEAVRGHPGTFGGVGTVPMGDAVAAVQECEFVKRNGLQGVVIGSNINGRDLDDERFWPIYEALEALELAVFIHPNNVIGGDRVREFHLKNLIGFPSDTTLAAARLIFSGTLDRFPKLRICLGQAGGFLPYIIGRLDHGFQVRPECRKHGCSEPNTYLRRFYYDTIIHGSGPLSFLIGSVGSDRVMFGSDFPFDMQSFVSRDQIDEVPALTDSDLQNIYLNTARRFYGLPSARVS